MNDWVSQTVGTFGQLVGIPDLELDTDGCAMFSLDPAGTLCLQDLQDEAGDVLVMLALPLQQPATAAARRAMRMADFRASPLSWQMQVALRADDLAVTLRVPRPSFLPSALEEAVQSLFDFHARVAQAE